MFSIIIPCIKPSRILLNCINSIIGQQEKPLFEIILIYKNSNEQMLTQIKKVLRKHFFKIIRQKNNGIYSAMNAGIRKATRKYLLFLGEDDSIYEKNTLRKIYDKIKKNNNISIFYGNVQIDSSKKFISTISNLWIRNRVHHQGMIYSKKCFKKYGYFDENFKISADYEFTLRCLKKGALFKKLNLVVSDCSSKGRSSVANQNNLAEVIKIRNIYFPGILGITGNMLSFFSFLKKILNKKRKQAFFKITHKFVSTR